MRKYKTSGWLWLLSSLLVIPVLGTYPLFDIKGGRASLALAVVDFGGELIGGNPAELVPTLTLALAWASCAAVLGWVLQGLILIAFHWRHEKPESSSLRARMSVRLLTGLWLLCLTLLSPVLIYGVLLWERATTRKCVAAVAAHDASQLAGC